MNEEDRKFLNNLDVLIVGSGPIGAIFARKLVEAECKVAMIDIGEQATQLIGDHKKNSVAVQKDISRFTHIVKGDLHPLSVPTTGIYHTIEPSSCFIRSFSAQEDQHGFILNGQNPFQDIPSNLPEAAATRCVGGMSSHWTCCTPRQHVNERSELFDEDEWNHHYTEAEKMFWTNKRYVDDNCIRQTIIKKALEDAYPGRGIDDMPLACRRSQQNRGYTQWASTASLLGDLSKPSLESEFFRIFPNVQCIRLQLQDTGEEMYDVKGAEVRFLLEDEKRIIKARKYVICAGAVLTPGILYNSGFRSGFEKPTPNEPKENPGDPMIILSAFGRYLTEQPLAFCQVVLKKSLLEDVKKDKRWERQLKEHWKQNPCDPVPFPLNDPDPQCYFPFSNSRPWHTQIHRDAFGYGDIPSSIDQRLVVDFRWFGYIDPNATNYVTFTKKVKDEFGMPQPIFNYGLSDKDADRCHEMITDMANVARQLGGFLPGAEPRYLPPGSALHICGTYRAGESKTSSVVSRLGKVWDVTNLVLGGCGVIPTGIASNPTLTAACFALAAAKELIRELRPDYGSPNEPQV